MTDMSKDAVKLYRPAVHTDGAACMVDCKIGFWVSKPDYDAFAAKLAAAERRERQLLATPTPAVCCLGLTPEQCAHTPSSQCEGLRPAVDPLDDPRVLALVKKARAVVDRWDSPLWKDLPHTGESIADLRAAIAALEENR